MNKFYFHSDRPYIILIPTIAFSIKGSFWIEVDWLHMIVGWGRDDSEDGDE